MGSDIDEMLARDVARVVVARVAPAELPTFRVVSDAYFADLRSTQSRSGGNAPLGFGAGEAVVLLTPVALMVATSVTEYLVGELVRNTMVRGGRAVTRAVRRLFGIDGEQTDDDRTDSEEGRSGADSPVELTAGQWAEVRRIVVDAARRGGLSEDIAELVGDAVVGAGQVRDEGDK